MLKGKNVVILAGSSGLGLALAKLVVGQGARVTITGRDEGRLASAAASVGNGARTAAFDGLDRDAVAGFFAAQGAIDHLASFVGDTSFGGLLAVDEARTRQVFEAKVWAQLRIAKLAAPKMAKDGTITFTGGTGAKPHESVSYLGNRAIEAVAQALAVELAPIRVNVVAPTLTDTNLWSGMEPGKRRELYGSYAQRLTIGRIPTADEVARSYVHLMESGLVTGAAITPDGGSMLK